MSVQQNDAVVSHQWSQMAKDIAVAGWVSFLAACLMSLLVFAWLDPSTLFPIRFNASPRLVYTLGFLFFWLMAFLASGLTVFMLRSEARKGDSDPADLTRLADLDDQDIQLVDGKVIKRD